MVNLYLYCKEIVATGNHNPEHIAEIIMNSIDSESEYERAAAWSLMRQAGIPMYSRAAFLEAAKLAIEIIDGDEPPRAA